MMYKKIALLLAGIVLAGCWLSGSTLAAQDNESFRRSLAWPAADGAVVNVEQHGSAAEAISYYNSTHARRGSIPGYRVRIFFSNSQNAREEAAAIQAGFRARFPGIPTYIGPVAYEAPSWMVTVGNCIDKEEFLILFGLVSRYYPSAFQWSGNIPISELLKEVDYTEVARSIESPEQTGNREE